MNFVDRIAISGLFITLLSVIVFDIDIATEVNRATAVKLIIPSVVYIVFWQGCIEIREGVKNGTFRALLDAIMSDMRVSFCLLYTSPSPRD